MLALPRNQVRRSPAGFTLVELMIAVTLGMLVLVSLVSAFVNSSRTRDEIERASQQIENGRYAIQVLSDDLRLAGYWAEFNLGGAALSPPASKPDPCAVTSAALIAALPMHIQGYDQGATLICLPSDVKANTDILVVRRASTCVRDTSAGSNCPDVSGAWYFQASLCPTDLAGAAANQYRLDVTIGNLNRTKKTCNAAALADIRQFITRIYFIANNDAAGDGIPTLKRVELGAGGVFTATPISVAPGIENLQLEYGIDTDNDGVPNALSSGPDTFNACGGGAAACVVTNWLNVMTVKINLLARNTTPSAGYSDIKTYTLGLNAAGAPYTVAAANDQYKRHVYQAEVRLANAAGRRE
jgi:type IV pilus assembly protein PilW